MSSSAVSISDDGSSVIQRKVDIVSHGEILDIDQYFQIGRSAEWIRSKGYKKVALQFPDELLAYAGRVVDRLRRSTDGTTISIMADTSYGSCCVDDITAEHCSADSIIHYGHSCLSPSVRYPVLYVYGRESVDLDDFCTKYRQHFGAEEKVLVFFGVEYDYVKDELQDRLRGITSSAIFTTILSPTEYKDSQIIRCGRLVPVQNADDISHYQALYIGTRDSTLSNLVISLNQCQFHSYNPLTKTIRKETKSVNRTLMKRFTMVEKTKDARIVGIICGASGHRDYHAILSRLKKTLKTAGKKYYTFVVGKLNVPKLANFMEVDVYVLVACQENSLLDNSEFYRPVVTPYEVELACNPEREWSGAYTTDFSQLLTDGNMYVPMPEKIELTGDVSLLTGHVRTLGTSDVTDDVVTLADGTVVKRNENTALSTTTAGDYLSNRSWTGLEQKLGETPVTKAVQGRMGTAREYRDVENCDRTSTNKNTTS